MAVALRRGLCAYDSLLKTSPYRTKSLTSLVIASVGDIIAQTSSSNSDSGSLDVHRVGRQAVWSAACSPLAHHWMLFLGRFNPLAGAIVDQTVYSPPVHAAYFAWISSSSSGFSKHPADIFSEVCEKLPSAMKTGWCVWPAAIAVNIRFVPLHYRVLFLNFVGLGYGILMSRLAYTDERLPVSMEANTPSQLPPGVADSVAPRRLLRTLTVGT